MRLMLWYILLQKICSSYPYKQQNCKPDFWRNRGKNRLGTTDGNKLRTPLGPWLNDGNELGITDGNELRAPLGPSLGYPDGLTLLCVF